MPGRIAEHHGHTCNIGDFADGPTVYSCGSFSSHPHVYFGSYVEDLILKQISPGGSSDTLTTYLFSFLKMEEKRGVSVTDSGTLEIGVTPVLNETPSQPSVKESLSFLGLIHLI
ncbi:hypothetical protein C5167_027105, partial [Papaver somniferum]